MAMSKVTLSSDATLYNSICNIPKVFERVSWTNMPIDVQPLLDSDNGMILTDGESGGFLLQRNDEGCYVIHTAFRPETKIGHPLQFARDCLFVAFISLDCEMLQSSACSSNPAARRLLEKSGFKEMFSSPSRFNKNHTETFYSLSIDDYILSNSRLKELGEEFHEIVEGTTNHADDIVHDRYAGAASAMIMCHNFAKAEAIYNRWAVLAGYEPMRIYEEERVILVGNMKIVLDETFSVVEEVVCQ